jgi:hypothetical protein
MYIVIIAWTYIIGVMALTSDSVAGGLALFAFAGLAPALAWLWVAARRARARIARNRPESVLEQQVRSGDHPDAEPDQR